MPQSDRFAPAAAAARGLTAITPHIASYGGPGGGSRFDYSTGKDAGGRDVTSYSAGGRDFAFYPGNPGGAYTGLDSREYGIPVTPYSGGGGAPAPGGGGLLDMLAAILGGGR